MHQTQLFILSQLCERETLRYRDMRPASMEASRFMYHLHALQRQGLVEKSGAAYQLTAEGKRYIDKADSDNLLPLEQARIAALIVCRHPARGVLYVQKTMQPAVGYIGFPLIDIPIDFEMPLNTFVSDAFNQATGLAVQLQHRGDGYINLLNDSQLEGSLLAHIMYAEVSSTVNLQADAQAAGYLWESDAAFDPAQVLASCPYVLELLARHPQRFFFEYSFSSPQPKREQI